MTWNREKFAARYRALRAEGLTRAECAARLGLNPKTMDNRVRSAGCWIPPSGVRQQTQDIERIAQRAACICDDVREVDPKVVLSILAQQCEADPLVMAQLIMALAAWVDPDESLEQRGRRVEAITAPRLAVAG